MAVLAIVLLGLAAGNLLQRTWYVPSAVPTTGSFAAGPVSDYFSVGQTIPSTDAAIARIDLVISRSGVDDAVVLVEIFDPAADISLRSGRAELQTGRHWYSFQFPPIEPASLAGPLYVRVRADPDRPIYDGDGVVVFYDRGNLLPGGTMFIRDEPAPSDWDLGLRIYRQVPLRTLAGYLFNRTASSPVRFSVALGAATVAVAILGGFLWRIGFRGATSLTLAAVALSATLLTILLLTEQWSDPAILTIGVALN